MTAFSKIILTFATFVQGCSKVEVNGRSKNEKEGEEEEQITGVCFIQHTIHRGLEKQAWEAINSGYSSQTMTNSNLLS